MFLLKKVASLHRIQNVSGKGFKEETETGSGGRNRTRYPGNGDDLGHGIVSERNGDLVREKNVSEVTPAATKKSLGFLRRTIIGV